MTQLCDLVKWRHFMTSSNDVTNDVRTSFSTSRSVKWYKDVFFTVRSFRVRFWRLMARFNRLDFAVTSVTGPSRLRSLKVWRSSKSEYRLRSCFLQPMVQKGIGPRRQIADSTDLPESQDRETLTEYAPFISRKFRIDRKSVRPRPLPVSGRRAKYLFRKFSSKPLPPRSRRGQFE